MHTATLKSGGWCASKAAPGAWSVSISVAQAQAGASATDQGQAHGGQGGAAWTAGKTVGFKKTLPRQTQIQPHGKKQLVGEEAVRAHGPRPDLHLHLLPNCGGTKGCLDSLPLCPVPTPWRRAVIRGTGQGCGLPTVSCQGWMEAGLGRGEVGSRRIFPVSPLLRTPVLRFHGL